jgi:hypothetical protein
MQMNSGGQVFQRLAEFETQSRKAAKMRRHRRTHSGSSLTAGITRIRQSAGSERCVGVKQIEGKSECLARRELFALPEKFTAAGSR